MVRLFRWYWTLRLQRTAKTAGKLGYFLADRNALTSVLEELNGAMVVDKGRGAMKRHVGAARRALYRAIGLPTPESQPKMH